MISEDQAGMKRHSFAFSCFFFCFSSHISLHVSLSEAEASFDFEPGSVLSDGEFKNSRICRHRPVKLKIRFSEIARLASDDRICGGGGGEGRGGAGVRNRREHADVWIRLIEIESLYLL